ncbi:MAG: sulfatase-like hydrolase/transferase [bacterium]|nr:sulfatase-like hydrolase/transferase [bacterium]
MLTRREFLRGLGLTAGVASVGLAAVRGARAFQPAGGAKTATGANKGINVLFLMTDEHSYKVMGAAGNKVARTPNIDRLAREGTFFENAFVPVPYCSPTRATLISGQYPHKVGVFLNIDTPHGVKGADFPSTEMILHEAGWRTAHRGKWHLGDTGDFACYESLGYTGESGYNQFLNKRVPVGQFAGSPGEEEYMGRPLHMIPEWVECRRTMFEWAEKQGNPAQTRRTVNATTLIGRSSVPAEYTPEGYIIDQVLAKMEEFAGKGNWMITCSISPPHDPWLAPEPYYSMIPRDKVPLPDNADKFPAWMNNMLSRRLGQTAGPKGVREYAAIYYGQTAMSDALLGRVLDRLDELGEAGRTLVLYTSDHGDMVGAHGIVGKSIQGFYDDLMHVPLIMRLPGVIPAGKRVGDLVSSVDIMPTLLDYAGQTIPSAVQGRSLRPLIEGRPGAAGRDYVFGESTHPGAKMVNRMVRSKRWKYIWRSDRHLELYDMQSDPDENFNLIGNPAAVGPENLTAARDLHARLRQWMIETGDTWIEYVPENPNI